ncbi:MULTISPECIES: P-type conjugative transfer protein TrbL [Kordiimonas]|jgi:type IV secretion system protein TrbL|uniref:P-type conjugative transfer protein TrbL n=1 Tax=Kordiimonas TaxID=288021 RepID=UPI00257FBC1E|nr:P-type conjugative transfer protein TrbL [Kordiimonas sp. UBA4487]
MDDLGIIDRFLATFTAYIDSGFGLLKGDVATLTRILIGIDITLAGLFWALADDKAVIPAFLKKVLYVGAFAFLIDNFDMLGRVVFESFTALGLKATGTGITAHDLMRPGFVAATGFDAALPLLDEVAKLLGPIAFFENFITIVILMLAWVIVLLAFFILSIQLFITILEYKLTTLAGFVLIPFALWNKSAFLAERVLGNVISSGIKMMVLATIVGIGSTLFSLFTAPLAGEEVTLAEAASLILGALSLFMLGIFGPGVAAGLVSGAPQLGAGAAVGSAAGLALGGMAVAGAAVGGAKLLAGSAMAATKAAASTAGGARAAYGLARATSGESGIAGVRAGMGGALKAGGAGLKSAASNSMNRMTAGVCDAYRRGERAAYEATGGSRDGVEAEMPPSSLSSAGRPNAPAWAEKLKREQRLREGASVTAHTVRDGDRPGHGENPKLREED